MVSFVSDHLIPRTVLFIFASVAILVVGMNHELESEGFDRPDMKHVGVFFTSPCILNGILQAAWPDRPIGHRGAQG